MAIQEQIDEGKAERQEDVREVQDRPPLRAGKGYLHQPAPQAEAGVVRSRALRE